MTGAFLRFAYYSPTLLDPDSTGYLSPALNFLINREFDHVYGRSYPYPLFLTFILNLAPNINFLSIAQHILSLSSILIFICVIEVKFLSQSKHLHNSYFSLLPLLLIALLTFDGNLIQYEKMLRPEGVNLSSYLLLLSTLIYGVYNKNKKFDLPFYTLAIILLTIFSLLHPRFVIAFLFTSIILLAHFVSKQESVFKGFVFILMYFAVISICYLPEYALTNKFDNNGKVFPLKQFFFSNIPLVYQILDSGEYANHDFDNTTLKKDVIEILSDTSSKNKYPILTYDIDRIQYDLCGKELSNFLHWRSAMLVLHDKFPGYFNGSYLLNGEDSTAVKEQSEKIADKWYNEYYINWSKLLVQKQFTGLLRKTFHQLYYSLFKIRNNFLGNPLGFTDFQSFEKTREEQVSYLTNTLNYVPDKTVVVCRSSFVDNIYRVLYTFLHCIFLIMLIGGFLMLPFKRLSILTTLSIMIIAAYLITVAISHTLDLVRYTHSLQPVKYTFMVFITFDILNYITTRQNKVAHPPTSVLRQAW